jgi:hypothetical protein
VRPAAHCAEWVWMCAGATMSELFGLPHDLPGPPGLFLRGRRPYVSAWPRLRCSRRSEPLAPAPVGPMREALKPPERILPVKAADNPETSLQLRKNWR